jgi:large subunit ribosomal protein L25
VTDSLNVAERKETGSLRMKRLRQTGHIPAVLYGHGEDTLMLSIKASELNKIIEHGTHVVDLIGSVKDSALIKDVQWDAFGSSVIHVDLARVSATEVVEVTLAIELKGEAPGTHEGGLVNFSKHEIVIACPARSLPDKLFLKINDLHLDQTLTAGDVPLPEGANLVTAAEEPIVSCALPTEVLEVDDEGEATEPEVIGAKPEEDNEG